MTLSPPILYAENNFDYGMRLRYKTPQRQTGTDKQTDKKTDTYIQSEKQSGRWWWGIANRSRFEGGILNGTKKAVVEILNGWIRDEVDADETHWTNQSMRGPVLDFKIVVLAQLYRIIYRWNRLDTKNIAACEFQFIYRSVFNHLISLERQRLESYDRRILFFSETTMATSLLSFGRHLRVVCAPAPYLLKCDFYSVRLWWPRIVISPSYRHRRSTQIQFAIEKQKSLQEWKSRRWSECNSRAAF